jgi:diacylglycerol kinase family enzyme
MKALIILKPSEKPEGMQSLRDALTRHFTADRIDYEVYETRKDDRLADIVRRRLSEGFELVVAAGGDGTVSAVCDGLVGSAIPLGIIPTGTGNLLARELQIPVEPEAAIALIAGAPCTRKIDMMRIGQRTFVLNASVGISASVIGGTTSGSKSRFGRIAYFGTVLRKVISARRRKLIVAVDGKPHPYRAVEVSVMNCGLLSKLFYPGGPDIQVDDGHLGVWILSMKSWGDYVYYFSRVFTGRPVHTAAQFIRAKKTVSIRSKRPLQVQADGDIIGMTPVDVEVLPGALSVLVPARPVVGPDETGHLTPAVGFHPIVNPRPPA